MAAQRRHHERTTLESLLPSPPLVQTLYCTEKEDAIKELLNALVIDGVLDLSREKSTLEQILEREKVATTAIGRGIAVPHAKSKFAERFGLAIGLSDDGIDFGARDGSPTRVIFLWVCPPAATNSCCSTSTGSP